MFYFTDHALRRLSARTIPKTLVERAVNYSDFTERSRYGTQIAIKLFGSRYLKVVLRKENDDIVIITAYWKRISSIRRYYEN